MKAARFYERGKPIVVEDHVDLGAPTVKNPPIVLGHEISGTIVDKGYNVTGADKGDRVLLPVYFTCGKCPNCRTGRENLCYNMKILGNHVDGGFAEYTKAPAKDVFVLMGATVIAVDTVPKRLELAAELGAADTLDGSAETVADEIKRLTFGGPDVVVDCAGTKESLEKAYESLRVGGRLCLIGAPQEEVALNFLNMMYFETEISGALGCRPADYPRVINLVRQHKVKLDPVIDQKMGLESINEALTVYRQSHEGKLIITP